MRNRDDVKKMQEAVEQMWVRMFYCYAFFVISALAAMIAGWPEPGLWLIPWIVICLSPWIVSVARVSRHINEVKRNNEATR